MYSFVVFLLCQRTNLTIFKRNCFTLVLRILITIIPTKVLNRHKIIYGSNPVQIFIGCKMLDLVGPKCKLIVANFSLLLSMLRNLKRNDILIYTLFIKFSKLNDRYWAFAYVSSLFWPFKSKICPIVRRVRTKRTPASSYFFFLFYYHRGKHKVGWHKTFFGTNSLFHIKEQLYYKQSGAI